MKTLLLSTILVCTILSPHAAAQRGGFPGGGAGGGGFRPGPGNPAMRPPNAHMDSSQWSFRPERIGYGAGYGNQGLYPWGLPSYYGDPAGWGNAGDGNNQSPQVIVLTMQPEAPPPPPPPPPEPAKAVTHEYNWPEPAVPSPGVLSLVLKDGTVRFAIAVWVQDNTVHYIAQDKTAQSKPLQAIDREATRVLNAQSGLTLSLAGTATQP